jgi:hypothetical protein
MRLWHRFHVWRARRMYLRVLLLETAAVGLMDRANELMRRHAEDPQKQLPGIE